MTSKKTTSSSAEQANAEAVETMASIGKETLDTVVKFGSDAAAEGYKNAAAYGQEQLDVAKTAYDKAISYGQDNMDAMSEASTVAIAGAEACFTEMADYTRTAMAENLDVMQRMFAVKSPQEFLDIQLEVANNAVTRMVSQTTKMNQIATESMTKASGPIKARLDETMETFVKPYMA